MNKIQKQITELSRIDPLGIAEKITDASYKEDESTSNLGFLLHIKKGEEMRRLLAAAGDTQFSMTVDAYIKVVSGFGFKVVYKEPFKGSEGKQEHLYCLFMKELGLLICFDSFGGKSVNGGHLYYNWSPSEDSTGWLRSSGHFMFHKEDGHIALFEKDMLTRFVMPNYPQRIKWQLQEMSYEEYSTLNDPIEQEQKRLLDEAAANGMRTLWSGYHDCREGIITIIKSMYENGKFFPVWHDCPFSWLTHYQEHEGTDMKYPFTSHYEATRKRIAAMPQEVRDCINNTYRED